MSNASYHIQLQSMEKVSSVVFFKFFYLTFNYFSLPELQQVMLNIGETLSEEEVRKMMIQADSDCDGLVSFDEFVVMMAK